MKTLLLSSAAIAALALSPAHAQDTTMTAGDDDAMTTTDGASADEYFGADRDTQTNLRTDEGLTTPAQTMMGAEGDMQDDVALQDADTDALTTDTMGTAGTATAQDEGYYDPSFGEDAGEDTRTTLQSDDAAMPIEGEESTPYFADVPTDATADDLNTRQMRDTAMREGDAQMRASSEGMADGTAMAGEDGTVTVRIYGVQPNAGEVYVALQTRDEFAEAGGEFTQKVAATESTIETAFVGVPPGEYAVAVFQDTNGDGTVTLGQAGPTEPWGFSGDVDGVPSFEGALLNVDDATFASVNLSTDVTATAMSDEIDQSADTMMAQQAPQTPRMAGTLSGQPTEGMEAVPQEMALIYRNSAALTPTAVTAKDFLDGELVSTEGEELAEVKDVIIDQQGQARGVILATGGLFGLGRDYYAVDFDRVLAVRMDDGEVELQSALTEEDVERLREFDLAAFEADMGDLMLASELREQRLPIGQTDETVMVDDVIMSRSGAVEALVVEYDGDSFVAPFGELGVAQGDGGFFIDTTPELIGALAVYEGRTGMMQPEGRTRR